VKFGINNNNNLSGTDIRNARFTIHKWVTIFLVIVTVLYNFFCFKYYSQESNFYGTVTTQINQQREGYVWLTGMWYDELRKWGSGYKKSRSNESVSYDEVVVDMAYDR
jgi:hypothetical protein